MGRIKDLTGKRFGKLTVVKYEYTNKKNRNAYWLCKCDCGNEIVTSTNCLNMGRTKSCGCSKTEFYASMITHGDSCRGKRTKLYNIWAAMKKRCLNPNNKRYKNYGGRGITICSEWINNYEKFKEWAINNNYQEGLTIDRIDNDGNYCPENCRWITKREQNRNTSRNIFITFNGEKHCLTEWAEILKIKPYDVRKMLCKQS